MNCKKTRQIRLREFTVLLQKTINTRSREIFSRSLTLKDDIFINEYYTLLYLFPIVNERLFIFMPGALSYGDIIEQKSQIMLLDNNFNIQDGSEESVYRTNNLISIHDNVGILSIKYTNKNNKVNIESEKFTLLCDEARIEPYCFSNFNYPLKYIIIKLLSDKYYHKFRMLDKLNLDREKIDNNIALIMVKYDIVMLKKVLSNKDISEEIDNPVSPVSKLDYIYIPKKILQIVNPELIQEFDNVIRIKRIKSPSPKKKIPIQKTTLDFFSQFPKSPTKKSLDLNKPDLSKSPISLGLPFQFNTMPIEQNIHSIQKEYTGIDTSNKTPFKKSIVKKASRKKLLPGQKFVDEFFNKEKVKVKEGSSILESNSSMALFLPEEEEEEEKQIDSKDTAKTFYEQARTSLNIIPKLKINSPKRGIKRNLFSLQDSDKKAKLSNSKSNSPKESNDRDLSIITIDSEVSDTSSIQEIDGNTFQFNLSVK